MQYLYMNDVFHNHTFEIWTIKLVFFHRPCSDGEWDECESSNWVNTWNHISLSLNQHVIVELTLLEGDQPYISPYFYRLKYCTSWYDQIPFDLFMVMTIGH